MWIVLPALITVHVIVCILLGIIVMMQRPKSEGLGAAFGSGMTENIFGAQTTNVLTRLTVWLGSAFFAITLILAIIYARSGTVPSSIRKELMESSKKAPAAAVAPSALPAAAAPSVVPSASPATQP